jgi:hypothetical protein
MALICLRYVNRDVVMSYGIGLWTNYVQSGCRGLSSIPFNFELHGVS